MESLQQLEHLCERLYNAQDPSERSHAESMLRVFAVNPDYASQCKTILDQSQSPYAQLMASSSLIQLATEAVITGQVRLDIRNYVIRYLATKGPSLQPFVTTSLVLLLCRLTKLGWFDNDAYREIVNDIKHFLQQSGTAEAAEHIFLGLKVLNQVIAEMNQPNPGRSLTQHRKTAVSFRDLCLGEIFQVSLTQLRKVQTEGNSEERVKENAVSLALRSLSFDFVGTSLDESTEDLGTIQVPSTWRQIFEDPSTMTLFFQFYNNNEPTMSSMALECLVKFASVRRSLFTSESERSKFLANLMEGTLDILKTQKGLTHHANYHEYCRLLGRLKTNYQLSELVGMTCYGEWIRLVAEFTYRSLQSWQWAAGSVFYLLGLWSRLVSSMPYLKSEHPAQLETYVPKIVEVYVTSRLESVQAVLENRVSEDPLDNEEQLQDQLDNLPYLFRFQYEKTVDYLKSILDPLVRSYTSMAQGGDPRQLQLVEGQLTWMVCIVGAIVRGRLSSSSAEPQEILDGELSSRVFQLLNVMDSGVHTNRYHERFRQRLDNAMLAFFQSFRKVYVGEQAIHNSKVYTRLNELMGLRDHLMVLNIVVEKIALDLKVYARCEEVIELTLQLFQDLAAGYMSGKLMLKLDSIKAIIEAHSREHFPFLDEYGNSRSRTTFYSTLARLLFMEVGGMQANAVQKFKTFMEPLGQMTAQLLGQATMGSLHTEAAKASLTGLFRDLRGIAMATNSRRTYGLLFDWLYPQYMPLLVATVETWADTPEATTPVLKFMAEFVLNKSQRLAFDSSSPNGILLFREVSRILCTYGSRVLAMPNVTDNYMYKYKGISVALTMLTRALGGNYVNFGVFELYGDRALSDALDMALKLSLSIPMSDIMSFRKVAKAYFAFLEILCQNHVSVICSLDTRTFAHIVTSMETGLKSLDVSISSQCAAAIDNVAAFHYNNHPITESSSQSAKQLAAHLSECAELFPQILRTLFEIILFEDCTNQWSLSRPMLSLILMNENLFPQLKTALGATLSQERLQRLETGFGKLMDDVTRSLESKNRDRFTQNLTLFRHDFRAKKP